MKIRANDITIRYSLEGPPEAPLVTMSHSLGTSLELWEPQVQALKSRYRVLRFDTRGHGGTDAPPGPYSLEMLASDIFELLGALGLGPTHFMGISMGGMIGQTLALLHPEALKSLILCDTTSRVPPEAAPVWEERIEATLREGMAQHVEPTLERWFTPRFREEHPELVEPVRRMILDTPPEGYAGCCHAIRRLDLTEALGRIALPVLIVVGEDDPGTPVFESKVLHERIPDSRLVVLKSAAHLSNREQPAAFNRAVMEFLGELEGVRQGFEG
ncbi:Alpha/beta hydrolase fold [uncultured Desulfatiglans sp.]|nr:Alpha/beta hydrolase fold [uncultured Desulfatiglans sp.]